MSVMELILASASPRRAELLQRMGLPFTVQVTGVDETRRPGELPAVLVERLARSKAEAARTRDALVLGADTVVVRDGRILGKPQSEADGVDMLLALSGRRHQVFTGVAVCGNGGTHSVTVATEVVFRAIEPDEAERYQRTGESLDKAGGYGIQGIGGIFVESIRGSYSAVMGLPMAETERLLRQSGLDTWRERTHG
jgi:septum formation protein